MVLWEPAWLHQRSPTNHCNCAVPKPPSPTLGLNHEIFENAGVKRWGSLAVQREMRDHRASLTRRRIESQPGSRAARAHRPLKENNYGCKRRYCAGSRSIVPTFGWRWGQCISVTVGESAGISACCWKDLQKFEPAGFPDTLTTLMPILPTNHCCLEFGWFLSSPFPSTSPSFPHPRSTILLSTQSWRDDQALSTHDCIPTVQAIQSCFPVSFGELPGSAHG